MIMKQILSLLSALLLVPVVALNAAENARPVVPAGKVALTEENGGLPADTGVFATNLFTTQAIDYMRARQEKHEPFLAYLPYNIAHGPHDMPPDARPGINARTATVENMDKNIGRLLAFLETSGLAENTLLVFILGDNGEANSMLRAARPLDTRAVTGCRVSSAGRPVVMRARPRPLARCRAWSVKLIYSRSKPPMKTGCATSV